MKSDINYVNVLTLKYFYKTKDNYILSELIEKLGMDYESFNDLISDMIKNGLLEYNNSLLKITKKGREKIMNFTNNIDGDNFIMKDINNFYYKDGINNIYIPNNFLEKI